MVNNQSRPEWSKNLLTDSEIEKLAHLVKESEQHTQGEIVPILVRRSASVGHVPLLMLSSLLILLFIIERTWVALFWGLWPTWIYLPGMLILIAVSLFLSRFDCFQRWFTSNQDESNQVFLRAQLEFHLSPVHQTRAGTGILIFASLMERRAVILADRAISDKVPQETWNEVSQLLTQEFKNKKYAAGFEKAILRSAELLKAHLPAEKHNPNEVCNQLVIKD
ncbi:MAG: TPM domain-containing protein [Bdellovibrionales bacterium]